MGKLERQLRVLPDLLNSCPDIASKVTKVRTLANIACRCTTGFQHVYWGRKTGEDLSHNPCYHCNWGKVPFWRPMHQTYLRSTMSQQRLNSIMLLNVHKDLTDGLALPTVARQFVDANERRRHFFGTVRSPQWNPPERLRLTLGTVRLKLFGNLTACILLYYANDYCIYDCRLHDCGWYHTCSN